MTASKKIVFQGEPGANSHLASREVYPDYEAVPCATFEDAFAAISSGEADLGMIPVENSVAGRVADIHHLMPHSGLHIVGEHFMPVRHQLLAPKGAVLADIKTVESHVHALGQCRKVIRKLGIKPVVAADTAGSAREVAEANDKTRAAIATRLAAYIYGLDILAPDIEDEAHNTTRFIVLSCDARWATTSRFHQPGSALGCSHVWGSAYLMVRPSRWRSACATPSSVVRSRLTARNRTVRTMPARAVDPPARDRWS